MKLAIIGTTAVSLLGFRKDLIKYLVAEEIEVFALATDYTNETRSVVSSLGATPIDYVFSRSGLNPVTDLFYTYKLSNILRTLQVDIVLSYFSKPVIFATFAAKIAGVKRRIGMLEGLGYLFTAQPQGIISFKVKMLRGIQVFLYRLALPLLEEVIFLNHDDPKDLIEHYDIEVNRFSILGGIGLNLDEYPYSKPILEPIRFVFVGRLLAEKGVHEFLQAAQTVKLKYPATEFMVLGDIDEANPGALSHNALEEYVEEELITHPGHVNNVSEWIAKSSVFVLPSYREGFPRSTQEAMAIGRAVITTDVPGCRETVIEGVNGFYVKPFSSDDLAEKMTRFIENKTLVKSMGLASHKIAVENYDSNKVNQELILILKGGLK
jgi:glycosyltransferase involved in cell wall biosynthesis